MCLWDGLKEAVWSVGACMMVNFGVWSDANWFKNIFVQLNVRENSDRLLPSLSLSVLTHTWNNEMLVSKKTLSSIVYKIMEADEAKHIIFRRKY